MRNASRGFTLIEVMIVVVIIGILASIAFPSYQEYMRRGYRAEGQAFLSDVAARQERYFSQNNAYITDVANIAKLGVTANSPTGKYSIVLAGGGGGYTLTANNQFSDAKCATLTLNALGVRGSSGSSSAKNDCWR